MGIDLAVEQGIPAHQATRLFPSYREGTPTHVSRVIRAIVRGSLARDGTRVRLEAVRIGGQWVTSAEAVQRWSERLAADPTTPAAPPRTPTARRKAIDAADRELERMGV